MTAIDWAGLSRLVPEIALVIVFAFFNYKRDELFWKKENERDIARGAAETKRDVAFLEALHFQQRIHGEGMGRIAEEVKAATASLTQQHALLAQHDQQAREYIHRQEQK